MFTFLTPYLSVIKGIILVAILAAAGYAGYRQGVSVTTVKWDKDKLEFAQEKADWAMEKAAANAAAATELAKVTKQAQADQAEMQAKFNQSSAQYQTKIVNLQKAQAAAIKLANSDLPKEGLWIHSTGCVQDSTIPASSLLPGEQALQCHIYKPDAEALVNLAFLSDQRTTLLNRCIESLVAVSTQPAQPVPAGAPQ
jgi:hypothetical protein